MDLAAHVISAGWASGVNAYLTVAMLSLLGRSGAVEVPDQLESDPILYGSLALFAIEFVADKVPYVDNIWDAGQTLFRPAIGGALGVEFAGEAGVDQLDEILSGGTAGGTALASHAVKAGLRLGINASPEPFSNWTASLAEDVAVIAGLWTALSHLLDAKTPIAMRRVRERREIYPVFRELFARRTDQAEAH